MAAWTAVPSGGKLDLHRHRLRHWLVWENEQKNEKKKAGENKKKKINGFFRTLFFFFT